MSSPVVSHARNVLKAHAPEIMTGGAIAGLGVTTVLAVRATLKASQVLEDSQKDSKRSEPLETTDVLKLVWKCYIPTALSIVATSSVILMANRIAFQRAASATALFAISERAFNEYKTKVVEKVGESKEQSIRDEVAQERLDKDPVENREVIVTGTGSVRCYDSITGRYFESDMETIRRAQNDINHMVNMDMYASLTDFYEIIGLAGTPYSDTVGWNSDNMMDVQFSTVLSSDGQPCISIDYRVAPAAWFDQTR